MSEKIIDRYHTGYHKNGEISKEGNLLNGKKSGTWKFYDNYGVLEKEENYLKGKKVGEFTIYDGKERIKFGSYRNNKLYEYTNRIFSGNILTRIERYREGKKHGIWEIFWDVNGIRKKENINFRNGKKHGLSEEISPLRTIQTFYKNGIKHGKYKILQTLIHGDDYKKEYDKEVEIGFYKEGKKHGDWIKFDHLYAIKKRKKIYEKYTYKNGKLDGECFFWFRNFSNLYDVHYKRNTYFENVYNHLKKMNLLEYINESNTSDINNTKVTINFKKDKLHGPSTVQIMNNNGRKGNLIEVNYKEGKKHGSFNFFTTVYRKKREINYKNGKLDGKFLEYDIIKGTLTRETNYKNGQKNGIYRNFDFISGNHILIEEGNFKNDLYDGIWKYYDEYGEIYRGETWKKGECVDKKKYTPQPF